MAEAHQAVAFQFVVTDEGQWAFKYDIGAVKSILYIFAKQYKKRYLMLRNRLLKTAFPASPLSLFVIIALLSLGSAAGYDTSFGILSLWESVLFFVPRYRQLHTHTHTITDTHTLADLRTAGLTMYPTESYQICGPPHLQCL